MEIIGKMAEERRVETMVMAIAHRRSLDQDLADLCQMVYLYLLEYDADKIVELWQREEIDFLAVSIIKFQLFRKDTPWKRAVSRFRERSVPLEGHDRSDG